MVSAHGSHAYTLGSREGELWMVKNKDGNLDCRKQERNVRPSWAAKGRKYKDSLMLAHERRAHQAQAWAPPPPPPFTEAELTPVLEDSAVTAL